MKKSAWYTNLFITISILPFMVSSCQKEEKTPENNNEIKLVTFKIDVAGVTMTSSNFKSLGDSIFDTFEHQYPFTNSTTFTAEDGTLYKQQAMGIEATNTTIKTATYRLPAGVYTVTGDCPIPGTADDKLRNCVTSYLPYHIEPQKVIIKEDTKSIPVVLIPDSYLLLIADPYDQIDTTTLGFNYMDKTLSLMHFKKLRYIYSQAGGPDGNIVGLTFKKLDGTAVFINSFNFTIGHLYKIYVTKNPLPISSIEPNPSFIIDSVKSY